MPGNESAIALDGWSCWRIKEKILFIRNDNPWSITIFLLWFSKCFIRFGEPIFCGRFEAQSFLPVADLPSRSRPKSFHQSWSLPRLLDFSDKKRHRGSTETRLGVRKEPLHQVGSCSGSNTGFCCLCHKITTDRNPDIKNLSTDKVTQWTSYKGDWDLA